MAVYSLSFTQKVTLKNIKIRQIFYSTNGIILSGGFLKQTVHLLILDLVLAGPFILSLYKNSAAMSFLFLWMVTNVEIASCTCH